MPMMTASSRLLVVADPANPDNTAEPAPPQ
jgi:hypothetical protein